MVALALAATVVAIPGVQRVGGTGASPQGADRQSTPSWATPGRLVGGASGKVQLAVALRWRHAGQLAAFDQDVSDPTSAGYGHYLPAGGVPGPLLALAHRRGPGGGISREAPAFGSTGASKSRMLIHASGPTKVVERAFATELRTYRYRGRKLRAPASGVSIPASLASTVTGVVGLDQTPMRHLDSGRAPARGVRQREALLSLLGKEVRTGVGPARLPPDSAVGRVRI